jgi:hypothetical protein
VSFRLNNLQFSFPAVILCALLVSSLPLRAADRLTLTLGDLGGEGWQASGLALQVDLQTSQDRYILSAEEIRHPALPGPLRMVRFDCRAGKIAGRQISCREGLLDLTLNGQKMAGIKSRIDWNIDPQLIDIQLDDIQLSDGKLAALINIERQQWHLSLKGNGLDIQRLGTLHAALAESVERFSLSGRLGLSATLRGVGAQLLQGSSRLDFKDVGFADASGSYIGQGLAGQWQGEAVLSKGQWAGTQRLALNAGELLAPQFYLSPSAHPLSLETTYRYRADRSLISLEPFRYSQPGRLNFNGAAEISLQQEPQLVSLNLTSEPADLAGLYRDNILPVLANPQLEDVELAGRFALDISHRADDSRIRIDLQDVYIEQGMQQRGDGQGQFALYDLDGEINWSSKRARESRLSWQGGHLFGGITLGATDVALNLSGDTLSLVNQANIPVLDGELRAEKFELERGEAGPTVRFQGYLTPISMAAISNAVGWPPLAGQLSGMIPGLAYEQGVIAVDGVALVKIFDGEIVIRDLQLDDLFGALPALSADLELKDIDLETLTRTFSFGKITGKLAGRVTDLRLEEWAPVSFDAAFATPAGDKSRRRISQKAVDNISNLGGSGVSGALSRSFLRIFEEFGYDRLGISCRLERGVCHMGGIEAAERGYYLVKGGGIPRIDIMGFNRETDWQVLVSKLKQIASGESPVIQ